MEIRDIVFVDHMQEEALVRWHSREHQHDLHEYELHFFVSGSGRFRIENETFTIGRYQAFLCLPGQAHAITAENQSEPLTYYALLFHALPDELLVSGIDGGDFAGRFPVSLGPSVRLSFEKLKSRYLSGNRWLRTGAIYGFWALMCDILAETESKPTGKQPGRDGMAEQYVQQAMELFQRNIYQQTALSDVAERLGISEEYLIKLFKKEVGTTPMRYFQNLKQEAAIHFLINTNMSIKEIGWKLGFSSQFHFSRNFKLISGQSPTEYRVRYLRENPNGYTKRII
jgi:AraC-like DNA-binding protein